VTARILHVNHEQRVCSGFVEDPSFDLSEREERWYQSLRASCQSGVACKAGGADLIDFFAATPEKAKAGVDLERLGVYVGFRVKDDDVWKRITAGEITGFDLEFDADGVRINFEEQQEQRTTIALSITKRSNMSGTTFTFSKSADPEGHALVTKCLRSMESGGTGNLTKDDFYNALEAVAKAYANQAEIGLEEAHDAVLNTDLGAQLYAGYNAAPAAPQRSTVGKHTEETGAWTEIRRGARAMRRDSETEEQAVTRLLREQPDLYDAYLAEHGS